MTVHLTAITIHSIDVDEVDLRKRGENLREDIVQAACTPKGVDIQEVASLDDKDELERMRERIKQEKEKGK